MAELRPRVEKALKAADAYVAQADDEHDRLAECDVLTLRQCRVLIKQAIEWGKTEGNADFIADQLLPLPGGADPATPAAGDAGEARPATMSDDDKS